MDFLYVAGCYFAGTLWKLWRKACGFSVVCDKSMEECLLAGPDQQRWSGPANSLDMPSTLQEKASPRSSSDALLGTSPYRTHFTILKMTFLERYLQQGLSGNSASETDGDWMLTAMQMNAFCELSSLRLYVKENFFSFPFFLLSFFRPQTTLHILCGFVLCAGFCGN